MACLRGFEPRTYGLEGRCSIQLSYRHRFIGAGEGNRTLATGLEGQGSTTELHPQDQSGYRSHIKIDGRGGGIRTPGPMVPNHVRYQTALHLETNPCHIP